MNRLEFKFSGGTNSAFVEVLLGKSGNVVKK